MTHRIRPADPTPATFETRPDRYRHWRFSVEGAIATLAMDVQEDAGLSPDYRQKLNSYDLAVAIKLADAVQRLRFEHPGVRVVIVTSPKERLFCAGVDVMMLRESSHGWKVNFCKYTNETLLAIEDASEHSGVRFLAALNGICAGGGDELALACDDSPRRSRAPVEHHGSAAPRAPQVHLLDRPAPRRGIDQKRINCEYARTERWQVASRQPIDSVKDART